MRRWVLLALPFTLCEAAVWLVESGSCQVAGHCISSPNFPSSYHVGECRILTNCGRPLAVEAFETESLIDHLTINGVSYSGTNSPAGIVPDGTAIQWLADSSGDLGGWKMCCGTASRASETAVTGFSIIGVTVASLLGLACFADCCARPFIEDYQSCLWPAEESTALKLLLGAVACSCVVVGVICYVFFIVDLAPSAHQSMHWAIFTAIVPGPIVAFPACAVLWVEYSESDSELQLHSDDCGICFLIMLHLLFFGSFTLPVALIVYFYTVAQLPALSSMPTFLVACVISTLALSSCCWCMAAKDHHHYVFILAFAVAPALLCFAWLLFGLHWGLVNGDQGLILVTQILLAIPVAGLLIYCLRACGRKFRKALQQKKDQAEQEHKHEENRKQKVLRNQVAARMDDVSIDVEEELEVPRAQSSPKSVKSEPVIDFEHEEAVGCGMFCGSP